MIRKFRWWLAGKVMGRENREMSAALMDLGARCMKRAGPIFVESLLDDTRKFEILSFISKEDLEDLDFHGLIQ